MRLLCDVELSGTQLHSCPQTDSIGTHRVSETIRLVRRSGSIRRQHACQPWHSTTPLRCPRRVLKMVWERGDWTKHLLSSQQRHRTFSCRLQIPDWEAASVWVDKNQQVNLALSHAIRGGLEVAGEVYGENWLNKTTRGFVSSLRMPTCTVTPRLVTDRGFELGLTSGGPRAFRQGDALGRKSL